MNTEEKLHPNELLDFYWNHYSLHAEQRLKILELFITLEIVIGGALASLIVTEKFHIVLFVYIGIVNCIVSCVCLVLDIRLTFMLHYCRLAIRDIEAKYISEDSDNLKLFTNVKTHENKMSFSRIVRGVYVIAIIFGVLLIIVA